MHIYHLAPGGVFLYPSPLFMASCISSQFSGTAEDHGPVVGLPEEKISPDTTGWSFVVDEQRETPGTRLEMLTLLGPEPMSFYPNARNTKDLITWGFTEHRDGGITAVNMYVKAAISRVIRARDLIITDQSAKEGSIRIARQELLAAVVSFYDHSKDS